MDRKYIYNFIGVFNKLYDITMIPLKYSWKDFIGFPYFLLSMTILGLPIIFFWILAMFDLLIINTTNLITNKGEMKSNVITVISIIYLLLIIPYLMPNVLYEKIFGKDEVPDHIMEEDTTPLFGNVGSAPIPPSKDFKPYKVLHRKHDFDNSVHNEWVGTYPCREIILNDSDYYRGSRAFGDQTESTWTHADRAFDRGGFFTAEDMEVIRDTRRERARNYIRSVDGGCMYWPDPAVEVHES